MFNQYEDEFGNYRAINEMPDHILESFDDLSKSIMFDPQYRAREATFTNSLRSDLVPDAIDPLMINRKQNNINKRNKDYIKDSKP